RLGTRMSEALAEPETYGLFTAAAVRDPYPCYKTMRERDPVHWSEQGQAWYFTRYRDVFELQDRPDLSVDRIETIYSYLPRTNPERFSDIVAHYNRWLLYRDDAYHDRLKALFLKAMTPRAVERLRPMIERRVTVLLDELQSLPVFDAYLDYAARIPTQVMLDLLGLPSSDEMVMRRWSDRCSNFRFQPVAPDKEAMAQEQRDILDAQQAYFMPLIEQRRTAPSNDLISAMVHAEAGGEKLTDLEILATCNMMATAGGGTLRSAIALSLFWVRQFPAGLAQLKADPTLLYSAAEEVLRTDAAWHSHCARGLCDRRTPNPKRPDTPHHDRRRKPRSCSVPRSRSAGHHPQPQSTRVTRPWRTLLPRRRAGAARVARGGGGL